MEEATISEWDKVLCTEEVKLYLQNKERLVEKTLIALYNMIWEQCSKDRVSAEVKYKEIKEANYITGLDQNNW